MVIRYIWRLIDYTGLSEAGVTLTLMMVEAWELLMLGIVDSSEKYDTLFWPTVLPRLPLRPYSANP